MYRTALSLGLILVLSACGGILAFDHNDTVYVGPLDDMNLNEMKSARPLEAKSSSFDAIRYGVGSGGNFVGICRTDFASGNRGKTELTVFDVLGQRRLHADEKAIASKLDAFFGGSSYRQLMQVDYLDCYRVGASGKAGEVVIYLQPQSVELGADAPDVAARFDVSGSTLDLIDAERFPRTGAPTRVVALENPFKGNTVGISNGVIEINGAPVLLNGSPVPAESVKHHFQ